MSSKQKLNTRSSTEAELVGINDAIGIVLWKFLEAQGYPVKHNIIYQDIMKAPCGLPNMVANPAVSVPATLMFAIISSPITSTKASSKSYIVPRMICWLILSQNHSQGSLFRKFRNELLNITHNELLNITHDEDLTYAVERQECVRTNLPKAPNLPETTNLPGGSNISIARSEQTRMLKDNPAESLYADVVGRSLTSHSHSVR